MTAAFVSDERDLVQAACAGFAEAHGHLIEMRDDPLHLVARQRHPGRRVGLVSGGGSGHEPLHAGFLGRGMLDAVAPGQVFASPHNRQVYEASRAVAGPEGVLHIVKNYTGDRINFGIAAERLRQDGVAVRRVLVDDDLATDRDDTATGRRGTAATVVVEKILGAAADAGLCLGELAELGTRVGAASRSLAVASRSYTTLRAGEPAFELDPGQLEYGVGIHGERAATSIARPALSRLLERMVTDLLTAMPTGGSEVLLVVNGLGSATALELYSIFGHVSRILADNGVRLAASLVGTYVAALDMRGFSLTLTRLAPGWLDLWRAPSVTPAFPNHDEVLSR
ncbi:dihydroxyacetone kinase subunit DhaK [Microbispora sp. NEAU-D428]|uniref:dihydroxyacetone kinase subunit DhaK n=1 Tax=Microbispora sitophila TaxID=2771537 RepID=UPI001869284C|nr:dihydroxyacetone kinase subunit DhaK [Microbispora sitophila]MBE3011093.1 dihydroxyacetone kinase subunit DhaK [Microbispora sitophila]